MKRKGPSDDKVKAARPKKLARTSAQSVLSETESATAWPYDVPRSMLSSFRVTSSPFQAYDTKGKIAPDASSQTGTPFAATGPEPMFDHSWRVTFVQCTHTYARGGSRMSTGPVEVTVCPPSERCDHVDSPPSALSVVPIHPTQGSPPLRRSAHHGDENRPPVVSLPVVSLEEPGHFTPDRGPCLPLRPSLGRQPREVGESRYDPAEVNISASVATPIGPSHVTDPTCEAPSCTTSADGRSESARLQPAFPRIPTAQWVYPSPPTVVQVPTGPSHPFQPFSASQEHFDSTRTGNQHAAETPVTFNPVYGHSFGPPTPVFTSFPGFVAAPHFPYMPLPPPPSACPPSYASPHDPPRIHSVGVSQPPIPHLPYHQNPTVPPHTHTAIAPMSHPNPPAAVAPIQMHLPAYGTPPQHLSAPWCTLYDTLKRQHGGRRGYKKRRASPENAEPHTLEPVSTEVGRGSMHHAHVHQCPFCPRTFTFPNSLAIHLKWHWGARIHKNGKGVERALRDAEKRREETEKLQSKLEQAFSDDPESSLPSDGVPASRSPLPQDPQVDTFDFHQFSLPVIAQSSFGSIFDFPFSFGTSAADFPGFDFDDTSSSGISPTSSETTHAIPSSSFPSSSSNSYQTPSSGDRSVPCTPDPSVDSGSSSNSQSVGHASPKWARDLFGDGAGEHDADGEGEDVLYGDDLFGDGDSDVGEGGERLGDSVGGRVSDRRAAFVSSASQVPVRLRGRGCLGNVTVLDAPRMPLLQLPPPLISGDDEGDKEEPLDVEEDYFQDVIQGERESNRGVSISHHLPIGLELAPLDDFGSLQSLPDVDAFERLSLS
ncbi:hypothetical protein C8Q74DRAFT_1372222 [Fomes fomentarius]|nr:hypothetical protein C8Q74DRAFT_1372222 [Fomes fomentarius]